MVYQSRVDINQKNKSGNIYKTSYNSQQKSEEIHWICCYKSLKTQKSGNMTMDQYLYIPFLGGWTSINPNYFHVNKKGVPWVLTHPCRIPTWQKRPLFFPFSRCSPVLSVTSLISVTVSFLLSDLGRFFSWLLRSKDCGSRWKIWKSLKRMPG